MDEIALTTAATPWPYDSPAGRLALEFANTFGDRPRTPPREDDLHDYGGLVAWAQAYAVLTPEQAEVSRAWAVAHPAEADRLFARAVALRETIYRVFSAVVTDDHPDDTDLAALNIAVADALAHARVAATGGGFAWTWDDADRAPDAMLWPVARDAADLLTDGDLARLRECGGDDCSWLFLDQTKNGSRHWCNMKTCGNRAKARRYRQRVGSGQ